MRTMCELSASFVRRARTVWEYCVSGGGGAHVPRCAPRGPEAPQRAIQGPWPWGIGGGLGCVVTSRSSYQEAGCISLPFGPRRILYCIFPMLSILFKYFFGSGYLLPDYPRTYSILYFSYVKHTSQAFVRQWIPPPRLPQNVIYIVFFVC